MNLKEIAKNLKYNISAIYLAYKKKDLPFLAKFFSLITVVYALSPIDLIPDFIPILGYLDDLIILPLLILISVKLIPSNIMLECQKQAKDIWKDKNPKKWYYSIPIILIWCLIIIYIFRLF